MYIKKKGKLIWPPWLPRRSGCEENFPFRPLSRRVALRVSLSPPPVASLFVVSLACNSLDFSQPSILFHRFSWSPPCHTVQPCPSFHFFLALCIDINFPCPTETLCPLMAQFRSLRFRAFLTPGQVYSPAIFLSRPLETPETPKNRSSRVRSTTVEE